MLIIRNEQIEAMSSYQVERFLTDCLDFKKQFWPETDSDLSAKELNEKVRKIVSKADGYGIKEEELVLRFLNLEYALGPDFDSSGQYDWVPGILADENINSLDKIEQLEEKAEQVLSE
jgi:hypothetical protein